MTAASLRLMLVEDEALIAMMAEDLIDALGHTVVVTAATLDDALSACTGGAFDAALLDVNLNGDSSMALATRLKALGCPFAFTTGYGAGGIEPAHADMPVLTKPYSLAELETVLAGFAAQLAGTSSMTSSVDSNRG
ncbi:response regulator [Sphingomonas sp. SUN039]|uniref:response regulator n=1 Tax=Sphingomonas sp. SUN039 TaxID=2937787 RepID=UPI002164DA78|nr:response regulator [Sphingomonas sp. SUN039]UVO55452.1 response regulator [Sphingomonas sp. SUN039]